MTKRHLSWALPCPACCQGGSDPQLPTGSRRHFLPPMCRALQTANQGLIFALNRGLEAFQLQKCHAHVSGPAAGPSIPRTLARLTSAPCTSQWQAYGHGGAETHARSRPSWCLGPNAAKRRAAVQLGPCFLQRGGSAHPWSGEVCGCTSLYLQWYFIYSRVCLARAV